MRATERFDVLFGSTKSSFEETRLCSVKEAADFILTHKDVLIAEEDGTPLFETERGVLLYCNDMQYRDELMSELRKGEGVEDNHSNVEYSHLRRCFLKYKKYPR